MGLPFGVRGSLFASAPGVGGQPIFTHVEGEGKHFLPFAVPPPRRLLPRRGKVWPSSAPTTPPSPPLASGKALWGGMITGRAARGCPTPDALPPLPTLPDAGAARDGPVLKTENGLGGVPRWPLTGQDVQD